MCMIGIWTTSWTPGIDCIKIEGRAKSEYYAAIVTGAYRHVLDEVAAGETPDPVWLDEVEHVSHRHYSTGFYYGQPGQYYDNSRYIRDWQVVAVVESCDANAWRRSACATSSARATQWRSWGRTASRSPWSFPRCATAMASRCSSREIPA